MKLKKYNVIKLLGRGSFGHVYKVKTQTSLNSFAIKKIRISPKKSDSRNIINEVKILKFADCPYILKMLDIFLVRYDICIVTDYANKGDLYQIINRRRTKKMYFEEDTIWNYFIQISLGVKYLHDNNIIHRDLKSSNIFIKRKDNIDLIKIGDFGIAKILKPCNKSSTIIGTPLYMSPEQFRSESYNMKVDIWSLGCILFEMIELKPPFSANTIEKLSKKIRKGKYKSLGKLYSVAITSFIPLMLEKDVSKRYSITQIINCESVKYRLDMVPYTENDFKEIDSTLYKKMRIPKNHREWMRLADSKFDVSTIVLNKKQSLNPLPPIIENGKKLSKINKKKQISKVKVYKKLNYKPNRKLKNKKLKKKLYKNYEEYLLERENNFNCNPISFKPTIISNYNYNTKDRFIVKIGSKHEYNYNIKTPINKYNLLPNINNRKYY